MGSITLTHRYGTSVPAYNISKAALNMLTVQWALALAKEGFTVMAISPGVRSETALKEIQLC